MRLYPRIFASALLLVAPIVMAATLPAIEPMPTLPASTLAPASLLNGVGYTVDKDVPVVGYMGQFTLRAPAGTFNADGSEMLAIRVAELASIAQASALSQSGMFAEALARSAQRTGQAIGQAVMNPVETVAGIPAGVGRFFQSTARSVSRVAESATGSGSPEQAGTADATRNALGVNRAMRQIARRVGADPYTTNPVLRKQLDDLAWASFAGGVSLDVALAVSTAGVATAVSATSTVSNLVWEKSPEDIRTINEGRLAAMGADANTIRAFVTNRWFPPTLSVPFVDNLAQLLHVKGRAALVALASTAASEGEARYMVNIADMARKLGLAEGEPVAIDLTRRIVQVQTRAGRMVVPAPVDYIVWTEPVKQFAQRASTPRLRREILVSGSASPSAREGLTATGWTLKEHSER
jgi:hypothetical protein